ncbi:MAG: DUF1573 domain-containing protein [Vampirovibrio sp.]|nr:DUF1573 domain-containing protein [Vampirovibrio sp.]
MSSNRSKNKIILLTLVILSVLGTWILLTTPGLKPVIVSIYEPAQLLVESATITFSSQQLSSKEPLAHSFHLYNTGGKPLSILGIHAKLPSTVVKLHQSRLKPGQMTPLIITLNPRELKASQTEVLSIRTNDPNKPVQQLKLKAISTPKKTVPI